MKAFHNYYTIVFNCVENVKWPALHNFYTNKPYNGLVQQREKGTTMNDLTIQMSLANAYHTRAYTNDYILCFVCDKMFYAVKVNDMSLAALVAISCISRASSKKGGFVTLRFRPTNAIKRSIIEMGNVVYKCTAANFAAECASNKYNKGENAERLVTENVFGEVWVKDSVPFTDGADVSHYQIKFEGATFASERQLS